MNQTYACDETSRRAMAERYAHRRMTAAEAEAFEDHFVACAECQREVRFASAVISALPSADTTETATQPPGRRRWTWPLVGSIALAAGLTAIMVARQPSRRALVALGDVREPPAYLGIAVRAAGATNDSLFQTGMTAYGERRYAAAITELRAALAAGQDSVPAHFFIGASLLFTGQAEESAAEFARVIALGDPTYRGEARYYRAKALLRLGRSGDARRELEQLSADDGLAFELGKALSDSLAHVRDR